MKAISLFSGAGGMDVGFNNAGFITTVASELDPHACKTFRENHPGTVLYEGDILEHLTDISSLENIDVVFGGPPCQGFSVAGKMDPNDPRSKLIFIFADIVHNIQPKAFVMENVRALGALSKFSAVREELFSRFHKSGYDVNMCILNAKEFGVPQSRERVFFIGVKSGLRPITLRSFNKYKKEPPTLRDAISHLGPAGSTTNERICNAKITLAAKPIMRKSPYAGMLFNGQGRPLNPDGWASTLPASMGGNRTPIIDEKHLYNDEKSWVENYHKLLMKGGKPAEVNEVPKHLRRLTIDEALLLQGFPPKYIFCGPSSKVYSQIGNAVPCKLAEVVAHAVHSTLLNTSKKSQEENYERGDNLELALC